MNVVTIDGEDLDVTPEILGQIRSGVAQLINFALAERETEGIFSRSLLDALYDIKQQTTSQHLSPESIEALARAVRDNPARDRILGYMEGLDVNLLSNVIWQLIVRVAGGSP